TRRTAPVAANDQRFDIASLAVKKVEPSPARKGPSTKLGVDKPSRSRARRGPVERQYVAADLHSRRSMIVRENEAADQRQVTRIDNDPMALADALAEAGPGPEVAIEA